MIPGCSSDLKRDFHSHGAAVSEILDAQSGQATNGIHSMISSEWCLGFVMQVKASLRSLPHAQAQLQEAEAACFGSQRMQMQQKADAVDAGGDGYNTQALQALQMLLLLLEFPKD